MVGQSYVLWFLGVNMNENVEIERRFLVDGRNDKPWQGGEYIEIKQYYLSEVTYENGEVARAWAASTSLPQSWCACARMNLNL